MLQRNCSPTRGLEAAIAALPIALAACSGSPETTGTGGSGGSWETVGTSLSITSTSATTGPGGASAGSTTSTTNGTSATTATSSGATSTSATTGSGPNTLPQGAKGCESLTVDAGVQDDGYASDGFTWFDADCKKRSATLTRNDAGKGGFLRSYAFDVGGATRTCKGTGANGWNGWGYVVTHFGNGATGSNGVAGQFKTLFAGKHHAIHEFRWKISPGGTVEAIVHWFFATGRSNPIYAITLDSSAAGADVVKADSRAPYGDLGWDGNAGSSVDGVAWGDKYKFVTTSPGPLTMNSSWSYTDPNTIPYALEWTNAVDAEMGAVATESWDAKPMGGDYGGGLLMSKWKTTGSPMLTDWLWPYQLDQYELPYVTTSMRVAWGMTYGAVGQESYSAFGKTISGYPYQSYSVYMVVGTHKESVVQDQVKDLESVQGVKLTATTGSVATEGPAGAGRTDSAPYSVPGWNSVYGAWEANVSNGSVDLTLDVGSASVRNPILILDGSASASAPKSVRIGSTELMADVDYFASPDPNSKRLWITFNGTFTGAASIHVDTN